MLLAACTSTKGQSQSNHPHPALDKYGGGLWRTLNEQLLAPLANVEYIFLRVLNGLVPLKESFQGESCVLLLVTGPSVSGSFVQGVWARMCPEVGCHNEVWSEQTLKTRILGTEALGTKHELAGPEGSLAYSFERPIRVGVWSG